jgi:hypothetical protein
MLFSYCYGQHLIIGVGKLLAILISVALNSLPAMDAHERPLFNELLRGLVILLIFVRC